MDVNSAVEAKKNPRIPDFRAGDTVRVMARVVEGDRERVQAFEGVVIRKRRGGINSNFTVRRVTHGIGVERTFLLYSPRLESVQVVRVGRVRRARLYYLRQRMGRKARIRAGSRDRFEELTRQMAAAEEEQEPTEEVAVEGEEEAVLEEKVAEVESEAGGEGVEEPPSEVEDEEQVAAETTEEGEEAESEPEAEEGAGEEGEAEEPVRAEATDEAAEGPAAQADAEPEAEAAEEEKATG